MNKPLDPAIAKKIAMKQTALIVGIFVMTLVAIAGIGYAIYLNRKIASIAAIVCLSVGLLFIVGKAIKFIYDENLASLKRRQRLPSALVWQRNRGSMPPDPKVNVILKDGTVCWKINPKDKDWSLDADNPIQEFMSSR